VRRLGWGLAIQARVLGEEHQRTLTTRTWLADMMTSGGRYAEAGEMLQDILATRLRVFGPDYPFTLATRRKLADVIALSPTARSFAWARLASFCGSGLFRPL
jgi:hypothetical protein